MQTWQLQEAKSRFSEVVELSLSNGPQKVTRRGQDAVVIISADDYKRLSDSSSLIDTLLGAPRGKPLTLERSKEPVRELGL